MDGKGLDEVLGNCCYNLSFMWTPNLVLNKKLIFPEYPRFIIVDEVSEVGVQLTFLPVLMAPSFAS